jgi:type 1 glutamine amidotransferase
MNNKQLMIMNNKQNSKKQLKRSLAPLIALVLSLFIANCSLFIVPASSPVKTLIVTGQNNHNWKVSHVALKKILENSGLFTVDVAVSPPEGGVMDGFLPDFKSYRLVVLDYNGDEWPEETRRQFVEYAKNGGGIVVYHAACAPFPQWKEYNQIIGLGGWNGRDEKSGPWIYLENGKWIKDFSPGAAGSHGAQHEFVMNVRDGKHPVMKGLPDKWRHACDELYDRLRGPGTVNVLYSACSDNEKYGGSGREEPMLFTVNYGKARIFHTALGHAWNNNTLENNIAMQCAGFQITLLRGCEWAATGKVKQAVPDDFPTEDKTSLRTDYRQLTINN